MIFDAIRCSFLADKFGPYYHIKRILSTIECQSPIGVNFSLINPLTKPVIAGIPYSFAFSLAPKTWFSGPDQRKLAVP